MFLAKDIHNMDKHHIMFNNKYYEYSTTSKIDVEYFFEALFSVNENIALEACIDGLNYIKKN